ncbi:hypothetical protein F2Q69_00021250 [Brassica cretica]|uniref:Uncharacterized protein n=1 Tax=Brassica cretica TaxID=69181 RepID=A0A8S9Q123_BRACR|nr:hypothetical protein F2Q69_00021250 [Brassica cretica]
MAKMMQRRKLGRGYFVDNRKDRNVKAVGGGAISVDERLESAATHHGSLHFQAFTLA